MSVRVRVRWRPTNGSPISSSAGRSLKLCGDRANLGREGAITNENSNTLFRRTKQSIFQFNSAMVMSNRFYFVRVAFFLAALCPDHAESFAPLRTHSSCVSRDLTFVAAPSQRGQAAGVPNKRTSWRLYVASVDDVDSMKSGAIRKELESYGIPTKSFLEKKEMIVALKKARAEGKTPIEEKDTPPQQEAKDSTTSNETSNDSAGLSREEKIEAERETCNGMKVGELKKELEGMGISTKSFFEKSEFVRALAEARVDGVKASKKTSQGGSSDEPSDPSYRDVAMQKFQGVDPRDPRNREIIDIRLK
eukprot:scaffold40990_cov56-Attheya_sp.AAC.4